jgi:hypothetical protein
MVPAGMKKVFPGPSATGCSFPFDHDHAFQDVANFLTGMCVVPDGCARLKLRDRRHGFATRHRQLRLLENGPLESRLLCAEAGKNAAHGERRHDGHLE